MAKIVIIGAGFAGHTAALYIGTKLGRTHEVTVINRYDYFGFVPSWVWVGVGRMAPEKTTIPLKPVYDRIHTRFIHGTATEVHPDDQFVLVHPAGNGEPMHVGYDYLIIATGPYLNYKGTPGLGPDAGNTYSICSLNHAIQARDAYLQMVKRMEKGEKVRFVIGTGHPTATCQGAMVEYISNIHKDLVRRGLRDKADLLYLSNEPALGDFGIGGVTARYKGRLISGAEFMEAVFKEFGIHWEIQKGVRKVEPGRIYWEDYDGNEGETPYDFAVLVPQFLGPRLKYIGSKGEDVSDRLTNKGGFILVDAVYGLPYDRLRKNPDAWPSVYQNPTYTNIFAAGIAFAPPGPISEPHVNPKGTSITAAPPRTGMISGIIGRVVGLNIVDLVTKGRMNHSERMTEMFAACIASMGDSLRDGEATTIVVYPVVPDHRRYPNEAGRDLFVTHVEIGLAGAWMKRLIHTTFMWKFQARPGWSLIPE